MLRAVYSVREFTLNVTPHKRYSIKNRDAAIVAILNTSCFLVIPHIFTSFTTENTRKIKSVRKPSLCRSNKLSTINIHRTGSVDANVFGNFGGFVARFPVVCETRRYYCCYRSRRRRIRHFNCKNRTKPKCLSKRSKHAVSGKNLWKLYENAHARPPSAFGRLSTHVATEIPLKIARPFIRVFFINNSVRPSSPGRTCTRCTRRCCPECAASYRRRRPLQKFDYRSTYRFAIGQAYAYTVTFAYRGLIKEKPSNL